MMFNILVLIAFIAVIAAISKVFEERRRRKAANDKWERFKKTKAKD